MKSLKILLGGLVLAYTAGAVVPPNGIVTEDACGHVNKSLEICLGTAAGTNNQYVLVKPFRQTAWNLAVKGEAYVGRSEFVGFAATDRGAGVGIKETRYNLRLEPGSAVGSYIATWIIDGKQQSPGFEFAPVMKPAALSK